MKTTVKTDYTGSLYGMNLQAPLKAGFYRPTLESPYAVPKNKRDAGAKGVRLGDCLELVAPYGTPDWMKNATGENEFEVIDAFRREKGFFEVPPQARGNPDVITAMIEAHFDSPAMRLGYRQWMV